jgi:hypothetical protein
MTYGLTYLRRTLQAVHVDDMCLLLQQGCRCPGFASHTVVATLDTTLGSLQRLYMFRSNCHSGMSVVCNSVMAEVPV